MCKRMIINAGIETVVVQSAEGVVRQYLVADWMANNLGEYKTGGWQAGAGPAGRLLTRDCGDETLRDQQPDRRGKDLHGGPPFCPAALCLLDAGAVAGRRARNAGRSRPISLGWDITDFGSGDFAKLGLLLFTVRNGSLRSGRFRQELCREDHDRPRRPGHADAISTIRRWRTSSTAAAANW